MDLYLGSICIQKFENGYFRISFHFLLFEIIYGKWILLGFFYVLDIFDRKVNSLLQSVVISYRVYFNVNQKIYFSIGIIKAIKKPT